MKAALVTALMKVTFITFVNYLQLVVFQSDVGVTAQLFQRQFINTLFQASIDAFLYHYLVAISATTVRIKPVPRNQVRL